MKIAGEFAYNGFRVKVYDSNVESLNSVYSRYQSDKAQLYLDHVVSSTTFCGNVLCFSRLEETLSDAQLIIECVVEKMDVKCEVLARISSLASDQAIIVSNTMRLDVSQLAERVLRPERFVGLRFLYPVYYIPEVELTLHAGVSSQVVERLRLMLAKMGKTLFFRSGSEPLVLSDEKREARKKQRVLELHLADSVPAIQTLVPVDQVPDLQSTPNLDLYRVYTSRHPNPNPNVIGDYSLVKQVAECNLNDDFYSQSSSRANCCLICMDKARNCVLRPCNHMISCFECSLILFNRSDSCPICRQQIQEILKVYMS